MSASAPQTRLHVLDANIFIESAKRYYAFDIAPTYWQALIDQCAAGRLISIDRVKDEIDNGGDALAKWTQNNFSHAFAPTSDADIVTAYSRVITWAVNNAQFTAAAKAQFAAAADGWLVAYAMARSCIVVTDETLNNEAKAKIKLPNACRAMSVDYRDTFQMLRALGVRL